jgi:hypothetical protein
MMAATKPGKVLIHQKKLPRINANAMPQLALGAGYS